MTNYILKFWLFLNFYPYLVLKLLI